MQNRSVKQAQLALKRKFKFSNTMFFATKVMYACEGVNISIFSKCVLLKVNHWIFDDFYRDKIKYNGNHTVIEFNMATLSSLLRRQYEQNPSASYFNVDILKYNVKPKPGATSCPFQLVSYWKCEKNHTDVKIDYKYNSQAMSSPSPLLNVSLSVPVDGGVSNIQSRPHSAW